MSNKNFMLFSKIIDEKRFMSILSGIYEHSPWVPERLITNGKIKISNKSILFLKMKSIVQNATSAEQLKLLNMHPELGKKLQKVSELTDFSKLEQKSVGLDKLNDNEFNVLINLNNKYKSKFEFPFIIAVKGLTKENIINEMNKRIKNSYEQEFTTALKEVHKIAQIRIDDINI
ncbi:MAG: 2-oxo-4-hydroxy-4-carboxy-5-ureidoimidazoline decarboxylase [Proteobacteria bacterium]|jgi:2-oxo-4-hydroxy-4-carboxy-5-ureidoimidazoline decarboxylase|nr:2-oxo-4-hydroxy-4-carboxy-5-ureidoimidazoline decarboxylase [Pseudomonadota bacterium]MDA1135703.1 2-oxo-4-hydroxy-4-carboxy-5-ureidoimidazoline decarboxylase [Pseudomonadota bacterium]|tara:strand:- start:190 stop:711 length:522 start_codon:yes stop_codon:yes gene_type:complete